MSRFVVQSGQHVKKGDIIGYVGSTGRSTGNHLHYEVRIDGAPVNPLPFVRADSMAIAAPSADQAKMAMGGPKERVWPDRKKGALRPMVGPPFSFARKPLSRRDGEGAWQEQGG